MFLGELAVLQVLQDGFAGLARDPGPLADLFEDQLDARSLSSLQTFLADRRTPVRVIAGFPTEDPIQLPVVGVTLGGKQETEQFVGRGQRRTPRTKGAGTVMETSYRSFFQVAYHCTLYSSNAELGALLSYIVEALLLGARDELDEAGLIEQSLQMADYQPDAQWLPAIVFMRAVILSGKAEDVVSTRERLTAATKFVLRPQIVAPAIGQ